MLLVSAAGEPTWLDGGKSAPLCGDGRDARPQATAVLETGCLLVLYSDGLVERRGERLQTRLQALFDAGRSLAGVAIEDVSDRLVSALGVESSREDDVAVLAVRLLGKQAAGFRRVFPAHPEELRALRVAMRAWLDEHALGAAAGHALLLAVGEASANAIEHAYAEGESGEVGVEIAVAGDGDLLVEVRDSGRFRAASAPSPERGRGTEIMRGLTEDFRREATAAGTTVRFRLPVGDALPA
jgi:anti-sigma regulatory factor (Ser/Thr protein kinase)